MVLKQNGHVRIYDRNGLKLAEDFDSDVTELMKVVLKHIWAKHQPDFDDYAEGTINFST